MIRVIINGCNGRMGQVLTRQIGELEDMEVVAGIDRVAGEAAYPVFTDAAECDVKADVLIDFSHFSAVPGIVDFCVSKKIPAVICTTALDDECQKKMDEASSVIPVFQSANMSLGINALAKAITAITPVLEENFNVEIVETHHKKKLDSPSGTAILLADKVKAAAKNAKNYIYGRHSKHDEFSMDNIGIHAIRGGTVAGEHTVIYLGPDEKVELKHTALSRDIFGNGAIAAARFITGKENGRFSMDDLV